MLEQSEANLGRSVPRLLDDRAEDGEPLFTRADLLAVVPLVSILGLFERTLSFEAMSPEEKVLLGAFVLKTGLRMEALDEESLSQAVEAYLDGRPILRRLLPRILELARKAAAEVSEGPNRATLARLFGERVSTVLVQGAAPKGSHRGALARLAQTTTFDEAKADGPKRREPTTITIFEEE